MKTAEKTLLEARGPSFFTSCMFLSQIFSWLGTSCSLFFSYFYVFCRLALGSGHQLGSMIMFGVLELGVSMHAGILCDRGRNTRSFLMHSRKRRQKHNAYFGRNHVICFVSGGASLQ